MGIKRKYSIVFIVIIALVLGALVFNNLQQSGEEAVFFQKPIETNDVEKIRMGKVVYNGPSIEHVDVDLSEQEVNQFRSLLNSVPGDRVREVQQVNPAIVAGVMFDLKSNSEARIQYDKKDVYVTRTDKKGQKKYIVDYPQIKEFFDNKLSD